MIDMLHYQFMQHALLAGVLGGISCALAGVWMVTMGIPFLGVTMSHAAFAGALAGLLVGVDPFVSALVFCLVSSLLIGPVSDAAEFKADTAVGIIFSCMLGLAFLFMAKIPGAKTQALSLIWGSILTVSSRDVLVIAASCAVVLALVSIFFKEIQAVLFSREIAASVGIPEKAVYYALLFVCGGVIAANLTTIGGLLIFSLVINPAAAAYQLAFSLKAMYVYAAVFGVISCMLGLLISYWFDVPAGAVIIISSSAIFFCALVCSPKKKHKAR